MKAYSFRNLISGAGNTLRRFPHALLCAVGSTAFLWYWIDHRDQPIDLGLIQRLLFTLSIGMVAFTGLAVFDERYTMRRSTVHLMHGLLAASLTFYFFYLPLVITNQTYYRFLLMFIAAHLAVSFSPFVVERSTNAFWQYNKILFLRILTAALYTSVLFIGLMLAILAVHALFDIPVNDSVYIKLFIFLAAIFNTWFFLSGVPESVTFLEEDSSYPKGLRLFTQYILIPLVTVYLLILYAYGIKILLTTIWPRGWVSILVIGFSATGILALLLVWPLRADEQYRWIRVYTRGFFIALFPLILLLAFAVGRRIVEYGITENRYLIIALAVWLFVNALYFLFSHIKNIKVIPMSLFALVLITGYGPFNAFKISRISQVKRLHNLLNEEGLLKGGLIIRNHNPLSEKANSDLSQILHYLVYNHGASTVQQFFAVNLDSLAKKDSLKEYALTLKIASLAGVDYNLNSYNDSLLQETENNADFNFESERKDVVDIKGYDYMISLSFYNIDTLSGTHTFMLDKNQVSWKYEMSHDSGYFVFTTFNKNLKINLQLALVKLQMNYGLANHTAEDSLMQVTDSTGNISVKILINSCSGIKLKSGILRPESFTGKALIKLN